jgi:GNAT superfamily N-acetyltransferase
VTAYALDRAIEEASLRAWPAIETARLDGWVLRFSEGFTGRANSVQALEGSPRSLQDRVAECAQWYGERSRPCLFRLSKLSEPGLDDFLEARGYRPLNRTRVLRREADGLGDVCGDLELRETSLHDWLRAYASFTGAPAAPAPMARIIERIDAQALLALLWRTAPRAPVACGLAVADGPHLGLFDLVVAPAERRRGYGTDLVRTLVAWGRGLGASNVYLQVTEDNTAALELYARLGFQPSYDYWYRVEGNGS